VTALAEYLARRGHDVHVFTGFPFTPHWRRRKDDRGRLFARTRSGGVTVHRVTHFIPRRPSSALQRILMEGSFSAAASAAIAAEIAAAGRPDAVVYHGAQPAIAMLVRIVSSLVGRPYVVNITDLAAELALDVGIVGRRLYRILDAFEFAAYRTAAGAVVLCRSFGDALVAHGYPSDRIRVVRDPIDVELIRPVPDDGTFRAEYGIGREAFVLLHAGSMGRKQGLTNIVAAAARTRGTRICWVLVGDGEAKGELVEAVRAGGLDDAVRFVPFQRDDEMSRMFAAADALVLNQVRAVKDTVIPSKLLTYMAAGRPVLAAVNPDSQAAEILRAADGGPIVAPEDPEALAAAARWCAAQVRETLAALGHRNRAYAEAHFDQRKILAAHEDFLLTAVRARRISRAA
jgi:glycosyltransferase involved in cell wall biosynthesis